MTLAVEEKIKSVFEKQSVYQWEMRKTNAQERINLLLKLRDAIVAKKEQFIEAALQDYITPRNIAGSQVLAVIEAIDYVVKNLEEWMKPELVEQPVGGQAYILHEARGRVCIFGTWNAPMSVLIHPLVEALAAGNCAVLKPSEFNPNYNRVFQQLIDEVFDEKQVALVQGNEEVSKQLLQLPFDHFFFTGSPRVGKIIMREAANHLAAVTLELGGKSPVIIERNHNPIQAAKSLVFGKVMMAGQFCISPDYLCVHEDDVEAFVEAFSQVAIGMLYEDGQLRTTERTQIVNEGHYQRLKGLYEDAISKGATVLYGGTFDDINRLIEPTILTDVTDEMNIAEEEIFGPLTFIRKYKNIEDEIQYIQSKPKPLALYIFSNNEEFQQKILSSTSSGGVTINGIVIDATECSIERPKKKSE